MTTSMLKGTYIGPERAPLKLRGERVIIQEIPGDTIGVRAQFNNLDLPDNLTCAWTRFPRAHFSIDPPINWENDDAASD